jgi:hypothetical protein
MTFCNTSGSMVEIKKPTCLELKLSPSFDVSVLRWFDRDNVSAKFYVMCDLLKRYSCRVRGYPHVQSPICVTDYFLLPTSALWIFTVAVCIYAKRRK